MPSRAHACQLSPRVGLRVEDHEGACALAMFIHGWVVVEPAAEQQRQQRRQQQQPAVQRSGRESRRL